MWAAPSSRMFASLFGSPSSLSSAHAPPFWHICPCISRWICTSPPCLPLSGWNTSWGLMSDRLTGVHHSVDQKNQQHDGCAPRWHLQPKPQSWFNSTPLSRLCSWCERACVCVCVCRVTDIQYRRVLHVSSTHHSVWWTNQYAAGPHASSSFSKWLQVQECCEPRRPRNYFCA